MALTPPDYAEWLGATAYFQNQDLGLTLQLPLTTAQLSSLTDTELTAKFEAVRLALEAVTGVGVNYNLTWHGSQDGVTHVYPNLG